MDANSPRRSRLENFFLGSLVALVLAVSAATLIPAIISARAKAQMTELLSTSRQLHMAIQQAALDDSSQDVPPAMFPADAGIKSGREFLHRLVEGNYISQQDADKLNQVLLIGNVSASDPADTIILKSKPGATKGGAIIFRKAGDGAVLQERQIAHIPGEPPRNPPYLAD